MPRPVLVGNALYFLTDEANGISFRTVSELQLPPDFVSESAVLTAEDGVLGIARVENSRLRLWSMETGPEGDAI